MPCRCNPTIIVDPPPCTGCLIIRSLLVSCTNSPQPCNDSGVIQLSVYNDVSACVGCDAEYTIESFDPNAFSSVTVDNTGMLTFITNGLPKAPGFYNIVYKVTCPCMGISAEGTIKVCIRDLCAFAGCEVWQTCDPCTGICTDLPQEVSVTGTPQEVSVN